MPLLGWAAVGVRVDECGVLVMAARVLEAISDARCAPALGASARSWLNLRTPWSSASTRWSATWEPSNGTLGFPTMPDPEPFAGLPLDEPLIDAETWEKAGKALVADVAADEPEAVSRR